MNILFFLEKVKNILIIYILSIQMLIVDKRENHKSRKRENYRNRKRENIDNRKLHKLEKNYKNRKKNIKLEKEKSQV